MECDQIEHIRTNKVELMKLTICNPLLYSILEAKNILHASDLQTLEAKKKMEGELAERCAFYDVMVTRTNSYQPLIEALEYVIQMGAANILRSIQTLPNAEPISSTQKMELDKETKTLAYRNLAVGSKQCRIADVVNVFEESSVSAIVHSQWSKLARNLGTSGIKIAELRQGVLIGRINVFDLVNDLLEDWKLRQKDDATVGELIDVLTSIEWNSFAYDLERKLGER